MRFCHGCYNICSKRILCGNLFRFLSVDEFAQFTKCVVSLNVDAKLLFNKYVFQFCRPFQMINLSFEAKVRIFVTLHHFLAEIFDTKEVPEYDCAH